MQLLANSFVAVHSNSVRLYEIFKPFLPDLKLVSNAVDHKFFSPSTKADRSGRGKIVLGWAGRSDDPIKGYKQFIEPLKQLKGVEVKIAGGNSQQRRDGQEGMKRFYDSIDAYICASYFEGSCNPILESAAMERAIITTDNGSVPEFLAHRKSALIVEQEFPNFVGAVLELRDKPALRIELGEKARQSVIKAYSWPKVAKQFQRFFTEALRAQKKWQPKDSPLLENIRPLTARTLTACWCLRIYQLISTRKS